MNIITNILNDSFLQILDMITFKTVQMIGVIIKQLMFQINFMSTPFVSENTAISAPQTKYYVAIILGATGFIFIVILIVCVTYKTRCRCISKLCSRNRIGHSDVSLTASVEDGMEPYLRAVKHPDIPRGVFIPRKPIKLGPIIEPYLSPPPKVELLYEVEPRPTSSRLMFSRSVFLSELSLRYKEAESNNDSNGVKIEEIDY